ncbi:long-chain fatty acid--CoA ligase [Nocardioides marmoriginsengisoli]|uniref:Long-chain-fatty-acid--CoA ligase n=1 Tax=Nocardioides marmoriginsengisoli TaxID=661483 RepID=A0A3N0CFK6_9ACTN|nr:class I adenylate-forming enzyme family protein [Nocardioides marmoriginsengisoli]RNL62235.1 long-chain fatty acid--CoA ligase [Nocardioides marmoriginsengisoli]
MSAPASNRLIDARTGTTTTWAELAAVDLPAPAAVVVGTSYEALPWVRAHASTGGELLVVAAGRMEQRLRAELLESGFTLVEGDDRSAPDTPREAEPGRLWLLTSGSTGRPKQIGHTLESLTTVSGDLVPRRWLCPYSPGTYAWWQVVTLSLATPGQDLVVVDPTDLDGWVVAAAEHGVTAASGTPTFWRQTLMTQRERLAEVPLEQVTLGGEPVDQAVLDQLAAAFPQARISWIYASSELGASIVVHDGRAGFPVEWLDRAAPDGDRPRLSVVDGELVIASPHHGAGLGGAVPTGDAVVVEDGRVIITGRINSDEINVGGAKVSAGVVRSVLTSHPEIAWAAVRGRKSALVGNLVVAEVVLTPGATDSRELQAALTAWCAERLPEYGVPRRIKVLDEIPATVTGKSAV